MKRKSMGRRKHKRSYNRMYFWPMWWLIQMYATWPESFEPKLGDSYEIKF